MKRHFRFFTQRVLPLVYDDSLSYYEILCKMQNGLISLEEDIDNNLLTSIDCIAKMPDLTYFDCSYNQVEGIPELDPLSRLQQFYASYNQIPSVAPLAGLPELTYVNVDYNEPIDDIEILSSCRLLVQVSAFGTHVKEVKMLTDFGVIVNFDPSFADQNTAE